MAERQSSSALSVVVHRRYNPEGITQYNIVPGLLGVILQMTMVMMTAMALTREIERGTMESLLSGYVELLDRDARLALWAVTDEG